MRSVCPALGFLVLALSACVPKVANHGPMSAAVRRTADGIKLPERVGECPPFNTSELYNAEARARGIEGVVKLHVVIGTNGSVASVEVVDGLGFGLDEAAEHAMMHHCKFTPAETSDGTPVAAKITYTFIFVLASRP
jgi:TonB family protein